jgi:hypothetical protein
MARRNGERDERATELNSAVSAVVVTVVVVIVVPEE